jgi:hydroxyacylglutathione hydrolase
MLFCRVKDRGNAHFSYVIGDAGRAVVIDPRRDSAVYEEIAADSGCRITDIVETHRNEDYLVGSVNLARATGAAVWRADSQWEYGYGEPVSDGKEWMLGSHTLRALHPPGHTPGSFSYVLYEPGGGPWMVFTGDALFAGDAGRVDLLGSERTEEMAGLLHGSIFEKILPLGDGVLLFPAHGYGSVCGGNIADREWTTIGIERRINPLLRKTTRKDFAAAAARVFGRPPYFGRMEELNLAGPQEVPRRPPLIQPEEFAGLAGEALVLDTRSELEFNAAHVPGSISIWEGGLSTFGGWLLDYERPLLLVAGAGGPDESVIQLARMGFDDIKGVLAGGMLAWHKTGHDSSSIETVTVNELCRRLDRRESTAILDVRGPEELEGSGRIPGSVEIELTVLPGRIDEVPDGELLFIFCGSGLRSTVAASLLRQQGREGLTVVLGGFAGWSSTVCPISRKGNGMAASEHAE